MYARSLQTIYLRPGQAGGPNLGLASPLLASKGARSSWPNSLPYTSFRLTSNSVSAQKVEKTRRGTRCTRRSWALA